jgi:hypothetical protein
VSQNHNLAKHRSLRVQLGIFRPKFLKDGDVGCTVLLQREEVLQLLLRRGTTSLHRSAAIAQQHNVGIGMEANDGERFAVR